MKNIILVCMFLLQFQSIPKGDFIILAILGQSNAAGYSTCPNVLPPVSNGIYNFGNDYILQPAQEPIDNNVNQVDMVSYDYSNKCGSSIAIAETLKRITGRDVVIVPCAKGGTAILEWMPSYSRDTLYGSCFNRIRTMDTGENHTVMIFFYQGESDAKTNSDALAWVDRFTVIVNALNTDLNYPPIVYIQVGKTTAMQYFPYIFDLANRQPEAMSDNLPNVRMVKSEDLTLCDTIHLDYASQLIIGDRAGTMLYFLNK